MRKTDKQTDIQTSTVRQTDSQIKVRKADIGTEKSTKYTSKQGRQNEHSASLHEYTCITKLEIKPMNTFTGGTKHTFLLYVFSKNVLVK